MLDALGTFRLLVIFLGAQPRTIFSCYMYVLTGLNSFLAPFSREILKCKCVTMTKEGRTTGETIK